MTKEALVEFRESLKSTWYYFINTARKEAIDWEIINLLEQAIEKIDKRMEFTPFKEELENDAG